MLGVARKGHPYRDTILINSSDAFFSLTRFSPRAFLRAAAYASGRAPSDLSDAPPIDPREVRL